MKKVALVLALATAPMAHAQTVPSLTLLCTGSENDSDMEKFQEGSVPNVNISIAIADEAVSVDEFGPVPVIQATPTVIKFAGYSQTKLIEHNAESFTFAVRGSIDRVTGKTEVQIWLHDKSNEYKSTGTENFHLQCLPKDKNSRRT